jgi:hypothetical protein
MGEVVDFPDKSATEHDMLEAFHRGVAAVHGLMDVLHENEGRVAGAAMTGVLSAVIRRLYDECDDIDSARNILHAVIDKIDPPNKR